MEKHFFSRSLFSFPQPCLFFQCGGAFESHHHSWWPTPSHGLMFADLIRGIVSWTTQLWPLGRSTSRGTRRLAGLVFAVNTDLNSLTSSQTFSQGSPWPGTIWRSPKQVLSLRGKTLGSACNWRATEKDWRKSIWTCTNNYCREVLQGAPHPLEKLLLSIRGGRQGRLDLIKTLVPLVRGTTTAVVL